MTLSLSLFGPRFASGPPLQYLRVFRVWPLGATLDQQLRTLVDSRDGGIVFLTHIYLLSGFSVPLFAYPLSSSGIWLMQFA